MESMQNNGYLIVNVVTARGAIPVAGAKVTVYDNTSDANPPVAVIYTDSAGKSEKLELPAPSRSLSEQPGNVKPYATYLIEVDKEGYYPVTKNDVPIFTGVTSIQPVDLMPLAEYDSDSVYPRYGLVTDEFENPEL